MRIEKIKNDKKRFLDLLLLADEQENMIDRYLERGEMFALFDDDVKSICVVTMEGPDYCELKNIATRESEQRKGYAKKLLSNIFEHFSDRCKWIYVGTGDNTEAISFYQHLGFTYSHTVTNFFIDHYDHPIIESGRQLIDMVYYKKELLLI
jgi:ribosomal protein S18 acetylase RimI-like enzyme